MHLDFGTSKYPVTKAVIDFLNRADQKLLRFIPDVSVDFNNVVILIMLAVLVFIQLVFVINNIEEASERYSDITEFTNRAFSSNSLKHSDSLILRDFKENIIAFVTFDKKM